MLNKKLFIFDLDGTLYLEGRLFEGVIDLLHEIQSHGSQVVFLTNNSSKSTYDYLEKLQSIGIPAASHQMLTSTQTAISYIQRQYAERKFYVMGTKSMVQEVKDAGIQVSTSFEDGPIEGVLMGYDNELTYQKLVDVSRILTQFEVPYIATNPDLVCPVAFGYVPDCGSYATMIYNATRKMPVFMGKPNPEIAKEALLRFQCEPQDAILIGDRLYTDILCGIHAGIDTALVLSGETTQVDVDKSTIRPTYVWPSVLSILTY
jgi:HAD superfamily hydrolase (TIGR01450 family)